MANKPGWSKPSTILFASEIPANERAFNFALAQAQEFDAALVLFHVYDTLVVAALRHRGFATTITLLPLALKSITSSLWPRERVSRASGARSWCVPGLPPIRSSATFRNTPSTAL